MVQHRNVKITLCNSLFPDSCIVVGNRTEEKDGYIANIIGYLKPKKLNNPQLKEFNKKNIEPRKHVKEHRLENAENLIEIGSEVNPSFQVGDKVCVQSKSTGKGFAGAMKRHNFSTNNHYLFLYFYVNVDT